MINIAIDGPAGAGKSTLAREIARRLHYLYVDTGALYRATALLLMQKGLPLDNENLAAEALSKAEIQLVLIDGTQRVLLNGEDVSSSIRDSEVSMAASKVSAFPKVREQLLGLQRALAKEHDVVMDGRDIGTVVLPGADVKIFLTASSLERARRRHKELQQQGEDVDFAQVLQEICQRDEQDASRQTAPLCRAEDAVLLDTSQLTLEQSIEAAIDLVRRKSR